MSVNFDLVGTLFTFALLLSVRDLFWLGTKDVLGENSENNRGNGAEMLNDEDFNTNENSFSEFDDHYFESEDQTVHIRSTAEFETVKSKLGSRFTSAKLLMAFWSTSSGYQQTFEGYSRIVQKRHPTLEIEGNIYPPHTFKVLIAQVLNILKIVTIFVLVSGCNPLTFLNIQTPAFFTWAINNKLSSCILLFLLGNIFETLLISTGAFEISFNGQLVWSKLESGRLPSPDELLQIIDAHLEMDGAKTADTFEFVS